MLNTESLLEVQHNDNNTLIRMRMGRLDADTSQKLRQDLSTHLDSIGQELIIDMQTVEFIDSSGVGCLLGIYKRLPAQHSPVKLRHVNARVQSVLELLRLHRIFEIIA